MTHCKQELQENAVFLPKIKNKSINPWKYFKSIRLFQTKRALHAIHFSDKNTFSKGYCLFPLIITG